MRPIKHFPTRHPCSLLNWMQWISFVNIPYFRFTCLCCALWCVSLNCFGQQVEMERKANRDKQLRETTVDAVAGTVASALFSSLSQEQVSIMVEWPPMISTQSSYNKLKFRPAPPLPNHKPPIHPPTVVVLHHDGRKVVHFLPPSIALYKPSKQSTRTLSPLRI